jgi:hypothetical protein
MKEQSVVTRRYRILPETEKKLDRTSEDQQLSKLCFCENKGETVSLLTQNCDSRGVFFKLDEGISV